MAAVIAAERLTKRFGELLALDALDLTVDAGEVFGLLGPNGAGKSTTIRLLLDLLRPTSGSVRVLGVPVGNVDIRRRIGYLPAELHLDLSYRGADVIEYFGALRGEGGRSRADEFCQRFELDPTRPIRELSTGNRRKIAIVQAFMHEPDLLILDEPSSGLDPLLQDEFHRLVREEAARGATVFLSSHMLPEVEELAERIGMLRAGRLIAVTDLDEMRARARQRIDFYADGPVDAALFTQIPGVVEVTAGEGIVRVTVEGSVDGVIKAAASLTVRRIVTPETDLEDLFLGLYREDARP